MPAHTGDKLLDRKITSIHICNNKSGTALSIITFVGMHYKAGGKCSSHCRTGHVRPEHIKCAHHCHCCS